MTQSAVQTYPSTYMLVVWHG